MGASVLVKTVRLFEIINIVIINIWIGAFQGEESTCTNR